VIVFFDIWIDLKIANEFEFPIATDAACDEVAIVVLAIIEVEGIASFNERVECFTDITEFKGLRCAVRQVVNDESVR
jgi:hypothetical protein